MSRPHFHFFSPANYCETERLKHARINLESVLHVTTGRIQPNNKWHGFANTDSRRAQELTDFLCDPHAHWLMATKGGYGTVRCLNNLLETTNNEPVIRGEKHIIGFSDVTPLLNFLGKFENIHCYHGPLLAFNFADCKVPPLTLDSLNTFLSGKKNFRFNFKGSSFNTGNQPINGTAVGGNLTLIASSCGTPFAIDFTDKILVIEEIAEPTYAIDRMLQQILLQPGASKLQGIVFGSFLSCKVEPKGCGDMTIDEVISDMATKTKIPVFQGFPLGHIKESVTLPIYSKLTIEHTSEHHFEVTIRQKK